MDIEKEIELIKERNIKVEKNKAWEISWTRRLFIAAATYVIAAIWLVFVVRDTYPLLKSFVPAVGYLLSTTSIPVVKKWWLIHKKR